MNQENEDVVNNQNKGREKFKTGASVLADVGAGVLVPMTVTNDDGELVYGVSQVPGREPQSYTIPGDKVFPDTRFVSASPPTKIAPLAEESSKPEENPVDITEINTTGGGEEVTPLE